MAIDLDALRARVDADLPWHTERSVSGTLKFARHALVLESGNREIKPLAISVTTIARSSVESTFGMMPALHVWHMVRGREVRSIFVFSADDDPEARRIQDSGPNIADRIGPGAARDAAQKLEGGLRALGGGLNLGMRTARQAVGGIARLEEYRVWPEAIEQAQARASAQATRPAAPPSPAPTSIVSPDAAVPSGDASAILAWFRKDVVSWLNDGGTRAKQLGARGIPVIQPQYPLDSQTCRIVVIGEFSRGKSTLINALFGIHGEIALPTGMTPTTPIACAVRVPRIGESDGATIAYRTTRPSLELTLDDFRKAARLTEVGAGEPAVDLHLGEARRVEVRVTGAYLPAGVEIEDTPGLNEHAGQSAGAFAALGRADLVLFVLAADQLLGDLERDVVDRTLEEGFHRNVLFLVNFWDSIDDDGQRAILRSRAETLLKGFPTPFRAPDPNNDGKQNSALPDLFFVSALEAARAQRQRKATPEESGIPQLRATLRHLLGPESSAVILRSRIGRSLRYARLLRQAVAQAAADAATAGAPSHRAGAREQDEAAMAAIRVLEGLPGAVSGATTPYLAAVRANTVPSVAGIVAELGRAANQGTGMASPALIRSLAAALRAVSAELAATAQPAVDLVRAQARAAFLARHVEPPALDGGIEPLIFTAPAETSAAQLRDLVRGVADLLESDLGEKAGRLATTLMETVRSHARMPATARASRSGATTGEDRQRLAALRSLEDDLLRIERLLRPLLDN